MPEDDKKAMLLARLAELYDNDDTETAHYEADQALVDFIGDPEIKAAYERIGKWYA